MGNVLPEKLKLVIFANCHGSVYKQILESCSNVAQYFDIEHIVSYLNLNNWEGVRERLERCDLLIINPIQNYPSFSIDNIRRVGKKTLNVIAVPFIRFDGFYLNDDAREVQNIGSAAVENFPKVYRTEDIERYLSGENVSADDIVEAFRVGIEKLKQIERTGDVEFVEFVEAYCKTVPLFRDAWHPLRPIHDHVSGQLISKIKALYPSLGIESWHSPVLNIEPDFGHYKPIVDKVRDVLNLQFDIESYFISSRFRFMQTVIEYENSGAEPIRDLEEFRTRLLAE